MVPRPRSPSRSAEAAAGAHLFFSDLNYEYVRINAEYTS